MICARPFTDFYVALIPAGPLDYKVRRCVGWAYPYLKMARNKFTISDKPCNMSTRLSFHENDRISGSARNRTPVCHNHDHALLIA